MLRDHKASTSYIQRRLQIGYNRAASLMERMEQEGVVGQANHAGKREILMGEEEHAELLRISVLRFNQQFRTEVRKNALRARANFGSKGH